MSESALEDHIMPTKESIVTTAQSPEKLQISQPNMETSSFGMPEVTLKVQGATLPTAEEREVNAALQLAEAQKVKGKPWEKFKYYVRHGLLPAALMVNSLVMACSPTATAAPLEAGNPGHTITKTESTRHTEQVTNIENYSVNSLRLTGSRLVGVAIPAGTTDNNIFIKDEQETNSQKIIGILPFTVQSVASSETDSNLYVAVGFLKGNGNPTETNKARISWTKNGKDWETMNYDTSSIAQTVQLSPDNRYAFVSIAGQENEVKMLRLDLQTGQAQSLPVTELSTTGNYGADTVAGFMSDFATANSSTAASSSSTAYESYVTLPLRTGYFKAKFAPNVLELTRIGNLEGYPYNVDLAVYKDSQSRTHVLKVDTSSGGYPPYSSDRQVSSIFDNINDVPSNMSNPIQPKESLHPEAGTKLGLIINALAIDSKSDLGLMAVEVQNDKKTTTRLEAFILSDGNNLDKRTGVEINGDFPSVENDTDLVRITSLQVVNTNSQRYIYAYVTKQQYVFENGGVWNIKPIYSRVIRKNITNGLNGTEWEKVVLTSNAQGASKNRVYLPIGMDLAKQ